MVGSPQVKANNNLQTISFSHKTQIQLRSIGRAILIYFSSYIQTKTFTLAAAGTALRLAGGPLPGLLLAVIFALPNQPHTPNHDHPSHGLICLQQQIFLRFPMSHDIMQG